MWKKEDAKPQGVPEISTAPAVSSSSQHQSSAPKESSPAPVSPRAAACISQGIRIKGEVTGSEDLFVDGQVEGRLSLANGSVTIGPNGNVKADITAREVIVRGRVEGKIAGRERIQLWSTGQVNGEVQTERLSIEDGAMLRGKVETGKPLADKAAEPRAAGAAVGKTSTTMPMSSGTAAD